MRFGLLQFRANLSYVYVKVVSGPLNGAAIAIRFEKNRRDRIRTRRKSVAGGEEPPAAQGRITR
jgi:hypothetical protein